MAMMMGKLYEALKEAKVSDDLARSAAEEFAQFDNLKIDMMSIKTDVAALQTDVAGLKTDVKALKTDVAAIKIDTAALRADFNGKFTLLYWMFGTNLAFSLLVVGKLFLK